MVRDWPRDTFSRQQPFQCFSPGTTPRQQQQQPFPADRYGTAPNQRQPFPPDQYSLESSTTSRIQHTPELSRRQPLMQIDDALRLHCGITARRFFVAAITDDGTPLTITSPGHNLPESVVQQFFDANRYHQVMNRVEAGADPVLEAPGAEDSQFNRQNRNRPTERRRGSAVGEWNSPARPGRKRPRARNLVNEDEEMTMTVTSRRAIKVGDSEAIWNFYEQRFKNCQQTACKLIAKAWVKAVEPKKQSTHPYTGSDEKAPEWWPKPWGPTKDDKVRHKEPDHLYKRERVHLLAHILRLVVEPNAKQHGDIRKLCLSVKKLEETTAEALSAFFLENDGNAKKKPYLNDIFKMARQEERYRNGEIDASTEVYVMAEDKVPDSYVSDNEDASFVKDEDDVDMVPQPKPTRTDSSNSVPMHGSQFLGELPVRGAQFQTPMMGDLGSQHSFVESGNLQVHTQGPMAPSVGGLTIDVTSPHDPHGGSRRPSMISEFSSPVGSIYSQQWPSGTAGQNSPMYAYASQQANLDATSFVSPAVGMNAASSFMTSSFDDSARPTFETGMFRPNDMNAAASNQGGAYDEYMASDSRAVMGRQHLA